LDVQGDRRLIVGQVLNYGTKPATDWLMEYYGKQVVASEAQNIPVGTWDKRSLALWSLLLDISPQPREARFK